MSYLAPPPTPAPVVVIKDVGGYVTDYENQTALYRASQREVRLHECRSACTLALSLPNVCVYPDSILKFHLAYDPRDHQPNAQVSQQMFNSYPAAVRARLGTLTREYKVLRGGELIQLGIRDCNAPKTIEPKPAEPRTMVASAAPVRQPMSGTQPQSGQDQSGEVKPLLAGLMDKMLSVFGSEGTAGSLPGRGVIAQSRLAPKPVTSQLLLAQAPLPPVRPLGFAEPAESGPPTPLSSPGQDIKGAVGAAAEPARPGLNEPTSFESADAAPLPPRRPSNAALLAVRRLARIALPKLITGAQPILPPDFSAYAEFDRENARAD
ncbi:MAG TPA: hypothetical protein VLZ74_04225 [Methylocella sp.]|nr:hypothetical protein [Methylocella sp.]